VEPTSSTGLSSRTASLLAYGGWWITGLIIWFVERRDRVARFHAAQAIVVFGAIATMTLLLAGLAAASLSFLPAAFTTLLWAAGLVFVAGLALWAVSLWKAASGREWRIPGAARVAERLCRGEGAGPANQPVGEPGALRPS
jgi:uncharacterized membrane protein